MKKIIPQLGKTGLKRGDVTSSYICKSSQETLVADKRSLYIEIYIKSICYPANRPRVFHIEKM